jgi:cytochrome c oxidase subunit II
VSIWAVDEPADDDADLLVEVTAFQWQWQFDYPESGVSVIGTDEIVPELVLPAGSTVRFELTSRDVIHSFWITGFRFKRDVFPHEIRTFTVDVGDRIGTFPTTGVCAEFCGLDHTTMRFGVRIVTPDEFDQWVLDQGGGS